MEKDMIVRLRNALNTVDTLEEQLKTAKNELDSAKTALIEHFDATGTERTATYGDIGFVTRMKPQLYASCSQENFDALTEYLEQVGRTDLIKPTVHPRTLSTYVTEMMEAGQPVPEFINYYLKNNVRLYEK